MRFDNLEHWLRDDIGDHTLADIVLEIRSRDIPYVEQSKSIYEAVAQRLKVLTEAAKEVQNA